MSAQILVADDEALIRESLKSALVGEGFQVSVARTGEETWQRFQEDRPDVVVLDLVLGDTSGLDLMRRMQKEAPEAKVLVITAHGSIESAVTAMKLGGYDFIKKPFELEEILAAVRNAVRTTSLERHVEYLKGQERRRIDQGTLVYASEAMKRIAEEVKVIASNPVGVVLITGESGTGKQVVARMLHDLSDRSSGSFVELNCSSIPENLVESELFGHERGAFSDARERKLGLVEIADGGTLFLDEIGDLGQAAQSKVLTFIEQRTFRRIGATASRRVDARIVAATNRELPTMVADRTFREDLFYRLNAMTLRLAPLRERSEDIPLLAEHFLTEASHQFRRNWREVAPETLGLLRRYSWPGNVRELRSVIGRAALMHDEEALRPEHLPAELIGAALAAPETGNARHVTERKPPIPTLAEVEVAHIRRVLDLCGGNRTLAAQHLGITRQTLSKRIGGSDDS